MSAASEKTGGGKIIPFTADRRLSVVSHLKRGILFLFVLSLFFSAYIYRGDLNMNNLKRITSYLNLGASGDGALDAMELDSGILNRYAVVGGGIAVLNRDTVKYINAAGKTDMEIQLGYTKPAISSSDALILCYDRGSGSLCVANTFEVFFKKTMDSPIIAASMGKNGAFCVVTDENGYRAAVTVFDSHQKEVYLWQTSEYFVSAASVSTSGKKMAAAVFSGEGIDINSKIIVFDTTKETPVCEFPQDGESILAVRFLSDSRIVVITNTKASVYDIPDGLVNSVSYDEGTLSGFVFPDDRGALLALDSGEVNQSIRLLLLDKNGKTSADRVIGGEMQSISAKGRCYAVLTTDKAYYFDRDLGDLKAPETARGAKEIYMRDDGGAFLIFNNRIELSPPG